jgi:hypothetical protein
MALLSAAPASADFVIQLKNYVVGGNLNVAKLNQSVNLPAASRFNGTADVTTGALAGHVSIPEFTVPISVLGLPTTATLQLTEAQPLTGTFKFHPDGSLTVNSSTSSTLHIRKLGLSFLTIPTTCRTSSPIFLKLDATGMLGNGLAFNGVTTIAPLTGCGLLGPTLSLLLSGPGNNYHITLKPPGR